MQHGLLLCYEVEEILVSLLVIVQRRHTRLSYSSHSLITFWIWSDSSCVLLHRLLAPELYDEGTQFWALTFLESITLLNIEYLQHKYLWTSISYLYYKNWENIVMYLSWLFPPSPVCMTEGSTNGSARQMPSSLQINVRYLPSKLEAKTISVLTTYGTCKITMNTLS